MTPETMNYLATFRVPVTFCLDTEQIKEARAALNTYYLGDPECNFLNQKTMRYEAKYPDKETNEFKDSTHNASMSCTRYLLVGMDCHGKFSVIQQALW